MARYIGTAPGVTFTEREERTNSKPSVSNAIGMVGVALKGPTDLTLLTGEKQAINLFGEPYQNNSAMTGVLACLKSSKEVYFKRVISSSAKEGTTWEEGDGTAPAIVFKTKEVTQVYNGASVTLTKIEGTESRVQYTFTDKAGSLLETYKCSIDPTSSEFIVTILNRFSEYIVAEYKEDATITVPFTAVIDGGDSGLDATVEDIIGKGSSGMKAYYDPEMVDISTLVIPTWSDVRVWKEALEICDYRKDIFFIPSLPFGLEPNDVANMIAGNDDKLSEVLPFNKDCVGLYWPNGVMRNAKTGLDEVVDIAPFIAATFAYADSMANVWKSPAGLTRGKIFGLTGLEYRTTKEERDMLYSDEINVNSVCYVKGEGICVMGARTSRIFELTDTNTALRYVSVRRMCNYIRKVCLLESRYMLFETNDAYTWASWRMRIDPYLRLIKENGGIYDYQVIMDETTVTADNIDRGEMPGLIKVAVKKPAEYININFVIAKNGTVSFADEEIA